MWFDDKAEEAVNFYVSLFPNAKIITTARYPEGSPMAGKVLTMIFQLNGQNFMALDGGPLFKFNEAISLVVNCETQEEIDHLWDALSAGGDPKAQQCGWLKDKYGVSWQIVPTLMGELMTSSDPARTARVVAAFMPMKKLDIAALKKAYDGN